MPEMPTSGVRSQLLPLQGALSTRSLPPAASTLGWLASIATAGSLTALGRYGVGGPATDTFASDVCATASVGKNKTATPISRISKTPRRLDTSDSLRAGPLNASLNLRKRLRLDPPTRDSAAQSGERLKPHAPSRRRAGRRDLSAVDDLLATQ